MAADDETGGVGVAADGGGGLALDDAHQATIHQGHGGRARQRVDDANAARAIPMGRSRLQGSLPRRLGKAKQRRIGGLWPFQNWREPSARKGGIRDGRRQVVRGAGLEDLGAQILMQGRVQHIEPDKRPLPPMRMFVPGAAGRDDEIAGLHQAFLAIDNGDAARALHDKTQGVGGVAMGPRALAGRQHLKIRVDGGDRAARAAPIRIGEGQHPPLGVLR